MVFSLCRSRLGAWKDRLRGKLLTPGTGAALTGWCVVSLQAAFLSSSSLAAITVSAAVDRYVLSLPSALQSQHALIRRTRNHLFPAPSSVWRIPRILWMNHSPLSFILLPPSHPSHLLSCPLSASLLYSILLFSTVTQSFQQASQFISRLSNSPPPATHSCRFSSLLSLVIPPSSITSTST